MGIASRGRMQKEAGWCRSKFLWITRATPSTSLPDINETHGICRMKLVRTVVSTTMTSAANTPTLLLPDLMTVEQEDIIPNDYASNGLSDFFLSARLQRVRTRKPIYWILSEVHDSATTCINVLGYQNSGMVIVWKCKIPALLPGHKA